MRKNIILLMFFLLLISCSKKKYDFSVNPFQPYNIDNYHIKFKLDNSQYHYDFGNNTSVSHNSLADDYVFGCEWNNSTDLCIFAVIITEDLSTHGCVMMLEIGNNEYGTLDYDDIEATVTNLVEEIIKGTFSGICYDVNYNLHNITEGSFTFKLSNSINFPGLPATSSPDIYEDDDTVGSAQLIITNILYDHSFHDLSDKDWMKFNAIFNNVYVIETIVNPESDTLLYLFGTDGTSLIRYNDDYSNLASRILWTNDLSTGIYYVKVREIAPTTYGGNVLYSISIEITN